MEGTVNFKAHEFLLGFVTKEMFEKDCFLDNWDSQACNLNDDEQNTNEQSIGREEISPCLTDFFGGNMENEQKQFTALEQIDFSGKTLVEILEKELTSKQELARHLEQQVRDSRVGNF